MGQTSVHWPVASLKYNEAVPDCVHSVHLLSVSMHKVHGNTQGWQILFNPRKPGVQVDRQELLARNSVLQDVQLVRVTSHVAQSP